MSDAGIVESITLKNFMCHSLLGPFAFGSNVNFVVGNNGSKSTSIMFEMSLIEIIFGDNFLDKLKLIFQAVYFFTQNITPGLQIV